METALARKGAAKTARSIYPGGVSILICTYNRAPLLQRMLESLVAQLPAKYPLEVLVIDNNSTDGTAAYAKQLAADHDCVRYVLETRQGLSHARNAGAAAARYEFLLYLDDDAVLPPEYLRDLGRVLDEHDPDFLGGPVLPLYADPKPVWFPESLERRYKTKVSGFDPNVSLTGANYGVRASVLAKVGGFDPRYGMTGGKTGMLEERLVIEVYRRITPPSQQKVYYSLENYVMHHTPKRRMTVKFQLRRIFLADYQYVQYCLEHGVRSPVLLARELMGRLGVAWQGLMKTLFRSREEKERDPEALMLSTVKVTMRLANLLGALHFIATDFGRVGRRRAAAGVRERPLEIVFVYADPPSLSEAQRRAQELARDAALDAIHCDHRVTVIGTDSDSSKKLFERMKAVNFRAADVFLTDSPKVLKILTQQRPNWPHLQFLLWVRESEQFSYLDDPQWFGRMGKIVKSVLRDRRQMAVADQTISTHPMRSRWLLRLLFPMRHNTLICAMPDVSGNTDEGWSAAWRKALSQAVPWTPQRSLDSDVPAAQPARIG